MPVHMGLADRKYDRVVFVFSGDTEKIANNINMSGNYHAGPLKMDPVDQISIVRGIRALLIQFKNDEVYVNVSGGSKMWSILFVVESMKYDNVYPFFVDQNNFYHDIKSETMYKIRSDYNIATMLGLQKQFAEQETLLSDYTADDLNTLNKIKKARGINCDIFNKLTIPRRDSELEKALKGGDSFKISQGNSFVKYDKCLRSVEMYIVRNNNSKNGSFIFSSPHAKDMVFSSGWFELEVAHLISTVPSVAETWLNVVFKNMDKNAKNEIDIICKVGDRLLFVECKVQIYNNTDIDKFTAAVKNYGGTSAMKMLVVGSKLKPSTIEKCEDNDVSYFYLDNNNKNTAIQLRDMVESNINKINKR